MRRNRIGVLLTAMATLWGSAGLLLAVDKGQGRNPWTQVVHDGNGRLVSAFGTEKPGVPLELTTETETLGARSVMRTQFRRGGDSLQIEKIYEGGYAMDIVYTAKAERLVVSLSLDDLTGESLVVYRLPDGEVFSLWISQDGQLLSGDVDGLRRALKGPMDITKLMRSYVEHKKPYEGSLPSSAERLIMLQVSCEDACAAGCGAQCAWECSFWGAAGCQVCHTACATGCAIGCWN